MKKKKEDDDSWIKLCQNPKSPNNKMESLRLAIFLYQEILLFQKETLFYD